MNFFIFRYSFFNQRYITRLRTWTICQGLLPLYFSYMTPLVKNFLPFLWNISFYFCSQSPIGFAFCTFLHGTNKLGPVSLILLTWICLVFLYERFPWCIFFKPSVDTVLSLNPNWSMYPQLSLRNITFTDQKIYQEINMEIICIIELNPTVLFWYFICPNCKGDRNQHPIPSQTSLYFEQYKQKV